MIKVSIYKNADNLVTGFTLSGHAEYADPGSDIVCAAVSALVINTINSIEQFTSDKFQLEQNEEDGLLEFHVIEKMSNNTNLLLNSLVLGLQGIQDNYTDQYITLNQVKSQ